MTCYEHLRTKKESSEYHRLQSYFNAIDNNTVEEYHNKHGRKYEKI